MSECHGYDDYEMDESVGVREKIFNMRKIIYEIFDVTSGCHYTALSDIGTELLDFDCRLARMEVSLLDFEEEQRKSWNQKMEMRRRNEAD